jgi:hypothetical protein
MLHSRRELMEMITILCQDSSNLSDTELGMAQARLRHIFDGDPTYARRLLCHAGAIIAISRECPANSPCEILRVFDAYAYVLAYTKFLPSAEDVARFSVSRSTGPGHVPSQDGSNRTPPPIRIDVVPWSRTGAQRDIAQRWISHGHGAPFLHGCGTTLGYAKLKASALQAIERLNVWDLSRRFYKTLDSLPGPN